MYLSKELKEKLIKAVKSVTPATWSVSFAVRDHATIVMTIRSTPYALKDIFTEKKYNNTSSAYRDEEGNVFYIPFEYHRFNDKDIKIDEVRDALSKIYEVLNMENYNDSDSMRGYHDVGYGVALNFGKYNAPYKVKV